MINEIIKAKNLDAVIITSPENLRYFCGFTGGEGIAVFTAEKNCLFVDGRYTLQAKEQAKGFEVIEYTSSPYMLIADMGFDKIGFEDLSISYNSFKRMARAMPAVTSVGVSNELSLARQVKRAEEIENIKNAQRIGDMAFEHILPFIKPGVEERHIALELEYFMKKNGGERLSFDTIVATGRRSALPHAEVTSEKIKEGDFVLLDYGCVYKGYCGDMTRTVAVGFADEKMKNVYDIVLRAQEKALYAIKPGVKNCDVDHIARDVIDGAGYESCFNHSLGHGVGLNVHEGPNLSKSSTDVLKAGNVLSVEPGIYIENFGGVRIEDLVCVTEKGYENLNNAPKNLIIL